MKMESERKLWDPKQAQREKIQRKKERERGQFLKGEKMK